MKIELENNQVRIFWIFCEFFKFKFSIQLKRSREV